MWLQMMEQPKRRRSSSSRRSSSCRIIQPDIPAADADFLQLEEPSDALLFSICTLRPNELPTVNLKGPIVINRHTLVAKQCIPDNAAQFSLRHPLPVS